MQAMKIVFDVSGEQTLKRIERLRGKLTPGQFLQQCALLGMKIIEEKHRAAARRRAAERKKLH